MEELKKNQIVTLTVENYGSEGEGVSRLVQPMARAAVAAGADGLMIEVHPDPLHAMSDGPQSLKPHKFDAVMEELQQMAKIMGKTL